MQEISASCKSSAEECRKALAMMKRLLCQNLIEKFWQQWILQQMGIQISQSENNATVQSESVGKQNNKATNTAYIHAPRVCASRPGNEKSTKLSTESARSQSLSLASMHGLTGCYKKPDCQLFNPIQLEQVKGSVSTTRVSTKTTAMSTTSSAKRSFQSSAVTTSSFQNYRHRLPAVRMARTKQTARKVRDA